MSEPFLGALMCVSFNVIPRGWTACNGALLPINQNQALFSLLGTTYGGDGRVNFALPDLRSRVPFHFGNGHTLGERGGEEAHTITSSETPLHQHTLPAGNNAVTGGTANATQLSPIGNFWANSGKTSYTTAAANGVMSAGTVQSVGGSQAHENRSPGLVLNFCIALQGIFPSQN